MRKFLFLLLTFLSLKTVGQTTDFNSRWEKINSLALKKGLYKNALQEIEALYQFAKKQKREDQQLKCLIYTIDFTTYITDNPKQSLIVKLETALPDFSPTAAAIVKSLLAEEYWKFYLQNQINIIDRTEFQGKNKNDITVWSTQDFQKKVMKLHLEALQPVSLLQKTPLGNFESVLQKGNTRYLRPTLFDLLAHRALAFMTDELSNLETDQSASIRSQAELIQSNEIFNSLKLKKQHEEDYFVDGLQIFQELLRSHQKKHNTAALLDADLIRLNFCHQRSLHEKADSIYLNTLQSLSEKYAAVAESDQAAYLIANLKYEQGEMEPIHAEKNLEEARLICTNIVRKKRISEGYVNCLNLLHTIEKKELSLTAEIVNIPHQAFRILTSYRNLSEMDIRIIKSNNSLEEKIRPFEQDEDSLIKILNHQTSFRSYVQKFPPIKSLLKHQLEVKIDGLEPGIYYLMGSTSQKDKISPALKRCIKIHVSNIAYLQHQKQLFVLDRSTGVPLKGAKVQLWTRINENISANTYQLQGVFSGITDSIGKLELPVLDSYFAIEIIHQNDRLFLNEEVTISKATTTSSEENFQTSHCILFTDRGIYRPGQKLYFKGILIRQHQKSGKKEVIPFEKTTVYLEDTNQQTIDSLAVQSNTFGSFQGSFLLPQNKLTGFYRLIEKKTLDFSSISVENYKKPNFTIQLNPQKTNLKLNDSCSITGKIISFAGAKISGATVTYKINRWPVLNKQSNYFFDLQAGFIEEGRLIAGEQGNFEIRFKAKAGINSYLNQLDAYKFEVEVAATDLTGETQTKSASITIGIQSFRIAIESPANKISADSLHLLKIKTLDWSDLDRPSAIHYTLQELEEPTNLYLERYWNAPDQFLYSAAEYEVLFPYHLRENENDPANWPLKKTILARSDSSRADGSTLLQKNTLPPGWYKLIVESADRNGEKISAEKIIQLMRNSDNDSHFQYSLSKIEKTNSTHIFPSFQINSNFFNHSTYAIQANSSTNYNAIDSRSDGKTNIFDLNYSDDSVAAIMVSAAAVKLNRIFKSTIKIEKPAPTEQLQINYDSYRDNTTPGNKETWTVTINGLNSSVQSEMLSTMYDASLNQLFPFEWLWEVETNDDKQPIPFEEDQGFSTNESSTSSITEELGYSKLYDKILDPNLQNYAIKKLRFTPPVIVADAEVKSSSMESQHIKLEENRNVNADKNNPQEDAPEHEHPYAIDIRKNFNETAFFEPQLQADSNGKINLIFTMPEALTSWRWMSFAHTKDYSTAFKEALIKTQKELMVQANPPRFLREGDRIDFTARVSNMTNGEMTGQIELQLLDPVSMKSVDGWFRNFFPNQYFTAPANGSTQASFSLEIPYQYNKPVLYRLIVRSGNHSDGEEKMIPILSGRILVTESLPLQMNGQAQKSFVFEKLKNSGKSETLQQHSFCVEWTSHPIWNILQALPSLVESQSDNCENLFQRFFATSLSNHLARSYPAINATIRSWKEDVDSSLYSNLEKNQELKSVLLEETPWVMEGKSESSRKKLLLDLLDTLLSEKKSEALLKELQQLQTRDGGFTWFKNAGSDLFITQRILLKWGQLSELGVFVNRNKIPDFILKALRWIDQKMIERYRLLIKHPTTTSKENLAYLDLSYLYLRTYYTEQMISPELAKAIDYFTLKAEKSWLKMNPSMQAMTAILAYKNKKSLLAENILKSLEQQAIQSPDLGMYWPSKNIFSWQDASMETQALMMKAFVTIRNNRTHQNEIAQWILLQKQTSDWTTGSASVEAILALLQAAGFEKSTALKTTIKAGKTSLSPTQIEAGTGYFKNTLSAAQINPSLGDIQVSQTTTNTSLESSLQWGAAYWSYFENLENIVPSSTPLHLEKKLYLQVQEKGKTILKPLEEGAVVHVGDKITVRLIIKSDRLLEYVHLKDLRAATLEPTETISEYKWQGGLGYYSSFTDAAAHFYFNEIPKGSFVLEYNVSVTHTGYFFNGISILECLYAPQFRSLTEGVKLTVE